MMTGAILFILLLLAAGLTIAWNHARGMTVFRSHVVLQPGWRGIVRTVFGGLQVPRPQITQTPEHIKLPFQESEFKSIDATRLHAWMVPLTAKSAAAAPGGVQEERDWVLTFNWFGGCKSDLLPHILAFHRMAWNVCAVDLRGHGGSAGNETTLGWREGWDVVAAISHLRRTARPRRLILHGVSLGAVAILRAFHLAAIQADGLILESPFDRLLHTVRHRVATFKMPGFPFGDLLLFCGGLRQRFNPRRLNPVEYAPQISAPVLILHGPDDPYITCTEVRRLADAFPTEARLEFIPGHGHGTSLPAHQQLWNEQVASFLDALPAQD